jgi:hypothetical protein
MLVVVAAIAALAYAVQDWLRLRDARAQFEYAWAGWQVDRATAENVVLTSEFLMKVEAGSPWISMQQAQRLHLKRLNKLLKDVLSPTRETGPDWTRRQADIVRRAIEKVRTADQS